MDERFFGLVDEPLYVLIAPGSGVLVYTLKGHARIVDPRGGVTEQRNVATRSPDVSFSLAIANVHVATRSVAMMVRMGSCLGPRLLRRRRFEVNPCISACHCIPLQLAMKHTGKPAQPTVFGQRHFSVQFVL